MARARRTAAWKWARTGEPRVILHFDRNRARTRHPMLLLPLVKAGPSADPLEDIVPLMSRLTYEAF